MVQDAGFNSEENKRLLQTAGGHYIIGEKLRQGRKGDPVEALSRPGRYTTLENGLEIKEVILEKGSEARRRYVLVRNPDEARRDALKRADIVKEVERRLEELKQDRKSTRLNSSHVRISYAVFCLKKKKKVEGAREARVA